MKKLSSLDDLKELIPNDYKPPESFEIKKKIKIQNLEAHYSVKGRAGTPVIIVKGFLGVKNDELKAIAKSIKNKLGIGGSIKNSELYFQGDKREKIIDILENNGHTVKRVGG